MSTIDLKALDLMEARATPGPYLGDTDCKAFVYALHSPEGTNRMHFQVQQYKDAPAGEADATAQFLIALRNAWPSLSSRMRAMQEEIEAGRAVDAEMPYLVRPGNTHTGITMNPARQAAERRLSAARSALDARGRDGVG